MGRGPTRQTCPTTGNLNCTSVPGVRGKGSKQRGTSAAGSTAGCKKPVQDPAEGALILAGGVNRKAKMGSQWTGGGGGRTNRTDWRMDGRGQVTPRLSSGVADGASD